MPLSPPTLLVFEPAKLLGVSSQVVFRVERCTALALEARVPGVTLHVSVQTDSVYVDRPAEFAFEGRVPGMNPHVKSEFGFGDKLHFAFWEGALVRFFQGVLPPDMAKLRAFVCKGHFAIITHVGARFRMRSHVFGERAAACKRHEAYFTHIRPLTGVTSLVFTEALSILEFRRAKTTLSNFLLTATIFSG